MDDSLKLRSFVEARGMRIVRKSDSRLMRFLSFLMFWNQTFMSGFYTTIGRTIYVPDPNDLSVEVLAHEYVHYYDSRRVWGPLWSVLYLFPQVLAPLGLLGLLGLANSWLYLLFILSFAAFPWPAPWRYHYEMRGYRMSLLVIFLKGGEWAARGSARAILPWFTTGAYYWMWPFKSCVLQDLDDWVSLIASGVDLGSPYDEVRGFLSAT